MAQLGPGTAAGVPVESIAKLQEPIAGRILIDGSSGIAVEQARCLPPAYFAPDCTPQSVRSAAATRVTARQPP
jgi:hypothetical protein